MSDNNYLSKNELELYLKDKILPLDLIRVIDAYDMAENAHSNHFRKDGSSYFDHVTRVCKIIISELSIVEPDIIIAALLHDIYDSNEAISREIVLYNFGPYVTFLIENIPDDFIPGTIDNKALSFDFSDKLRSPGDDYIIIRLAKHLDNFRNLTFTPNFNPIQYINDFISNYSPIAENSLDERILYLISELRIERNKFYC